MILVTGATGNAGGAVVRALVEAGEPVRALVRDDLPAVSMRRLTDRVRRVSPARASSASV